MFTLFKNAVVYLYREGEIVPEDLNEQLQALAFTACGPHDMSRNGWKALDGEGQYTLKVNNHILLCMQTEKKIIPPGHLKKEINSRVKVIEEEQHRRLKYTERATIKEDILQSLLPRAFPRRTETQIWIDQDNKRVIIDTASTKTAENALALLRKTLGSLPVVPLTPENPVELVMTEWVKAGEAPAPLHMPEECDAKMVDILSDGGTASFRNEPLGSEIIMSTMSSGKLVTNLNLYHATKFHVNFTMTDSCIFKRLKFSDLFLETNDEMQEEDDAGSDVRKRADFLLMAQTVSEVISDSLAAFGGEAKWR
ncbi:recombination-associated protein RdgC (plasmid) [Serratia sp. JSRIV002]|uniref:recombination-associated protein RdgC n=1 Tax=Serratia sp. JSRIV002 TaxID=2831894 RepID=UPI001CBD7891|nr:recombination-associated protein RdgC [Serratia sp. JSRIV002]UAN54754.1 recombination-associated protein RdgC [Serratia sp. JSRIV002]